MNAFAFFGRDIPERPLDPPDTSLEPWEENAISAREDDEAEAICEALNDFDDLVLSPALEGTPLRSELALLCQLPITELSMRERRMRSALMPYLNAAARVRAGS